jgi:hypothetical protein
VIHVLALFFFLASSVLARADWQQQLTPSAPGPFPLPRPMSAFYRCSWSGLSAGELNVAFSRAKGDVLQLEGKGGTTGLARTLWRMDVTHSAQADAGSLQPLNMLQVETYRAETLRTELKFDEKGVARLRENKPADKNPPKWKRFDFPNLRDLHTAWFFIRSQKLQTGQTLNLVVYPAADPYLATVRVLGREKIKVRAGTYPAIKLDLKLQKITRELALEPHGKFKRATGWISDDGDRMLLKVQAEIFVGSVSVELDRVKFTGADQRIQIPR